MGEAVANVARRINATMEDGLDTLDLSNCNLISFPDGVLKMIRSCADKIHKITLANNQLKNLGDKFFTMFTQLKELDLQGNMLTKLPDAIGELQHLISINLSNNNFSVFPEQLTNVHTLQNINMSRNQIAGAVGACVRDAVPERCGFEIQSNYFITTYFKEFYSTHIDTQTVVICWIG